MTRRATTRRRAAKAPGTSVDVDNNAPAGGTVLGERERRFVERFMACGNATKAAELAGYSKKTASQIGYRLLRKVQIQQAIAERTANDPAVWTREDRQRFWTAIASGARGFQLASLRDRLKASELLGKSQADFVDRVEHEAGASLLELLAAARGAK